MPEDNKTRRRALVTGAGRGIGLAVAERLVNEGMDVTLLDVDEDVASVAERLGAGALCVDLLDWSSAAEAIKASTDSGPFWLLVNNAGIFHRAPLLETPPEDFLRVYNVNVTSMLVTMQSVIPTMIQQGGGRVINMASMAAKLGTPGEAAYAASKSAVVGLSRIAAMEVGEHGITVNSILPGYVLTDMGAATRTEQDIARWSSQSPLGRLAGTDDVAGLVSFLASDEAGYITGEALNMTGGMCTW